MKVDAIKTNAMKKLKEAVIFFTITFLQHANSLIGISTLS